jgi:hypothetical protein
VLGGNRFAGEGAGLLRTFLFGQRWHWVVYQACVLDALISLRKEIKVAERPHQNDREIGGLASINWGDGLDDDALPLQSRTSS